MAASSNGNFFKRFINRILDFMYYDFSFYFVKSLLWVVIVICAVVWMPFYLVYMLLIGDRKEKKKHMELQRKMKEEHPDLQFFMEHIDAFMRLYEDICKDKEIYDFMFSRYCYVVPTQIPCGFKYQTLGSLLGQYKDRKSGWLTNDRYVIFGIIHVLSGGIYVTVWDDKDKEWKETQMEPKTLRWTTAEHEFEPGEYVRGKELSELFEKIKEYKKSKTLAKRGDNG